MKLKEIITENELSVLYHGTNKANFETIFKEGLDPAKSVHADDEESNDYENGKWGYYGPPYHFVYLSTSPAVAGSFAPGGDNHTSIDLNQRIILEIRLPPNLQNKLITDRGEFIRAPFIIPPKFIRIYQ